MHPEIKKKWVEALRSGNYPQAKGALRKPAGYCTIGVLCDLYGLEKGLDWSAPQPGALTDDYFFMGSCDWPPQEVVEWADLPSEDPKVKLVPDGETIVLSEPCLSDLNDTGFDFKMIAKIIEEQL